MRLKYPEVVNCLIIAEENIIEKELNSLQGTHEKSLNCLISEHFTKMKV